MYAVKTEITDPNATVFVLHAQKTMYGGKHVAKGDELFVFASENEGGRGLIARAIVLTSSTTPKVLGLERQTPRVSIKAQRTDTARKPLGRNELKSFRNWQDGRPETELNFKFYRQATNKVVGLSREAAAWSCPSAWCKSTARTELRCAVLSGLLPTAEWAQYR